MALELVVNYNSYVTLEEADEYVQSHYLSTSPEYKAWFNDSLSREDKIRSLIASARALNNLRYKGRKKVPGQKLAFPRVFNTFPGHLYLPFVSQYMDSSLLEGVGGSDGLEAAKEAQIVNSVAHLTLSPNIVTSVTERTVQGILYSKAGSAAESYESSLDRSGNLMKGIYNQDKVFYILNAWLTDSVFTL